MRHLYLHSRHLRHSYAYIYGSAVSVYDQSQFITKALFESIGGYDENYTKYEYNILINELYKRRQFVVINKKLKTSARLNKKVGVWNVQYHFWAIYVKRWFGASADELYAYYKKHLKM